MISDKKMKRPQNYMGNHGTVANSSYFGGSNGNTSAAIYPLVAATAGHPNLFMLNNPANANHMNQMSGIYYNMPPPYNYPIYPQNFGNVAPVSASIMTNNSSTNYTVPRLVYPYFQNGSNYPAHIHSLPLSNANIKQQQQASVQGSTYGVGDANPALLAPATGITNGSNAGTNLETTSTTPPEESGPANVVSQVGAIAGVSTGQVGNNGLRSHSTNFISNAGSNSVSTPPNNNVATPSFYQTNPQQAIGNNGMGYQYYPGAQGPIMVPIGIYNGGGGAGGISNNQATPNNTLNAGGSLAGQHAANFNNGHVIMAPNTLNFPGITANGGPSGRANVVRNPVSHLDPLGAGMNLAGNKKSNNGGLPASGSYFYNPASNYGGGGTPAYQPTPLLTSMASSYMSHVPVSLPHGKFLGGTMSSTSSETNATDKEGSNNGNGSHNPGYNNSVASGKDGLIPPQLQFDSPPSSASTTAGATTKKSAIIISHPDTGCVYTIQELTKDDTIDMSLIKEFQQKIYNKALGMEEDASSSSFDKANETDGGIDDKESTSLPTTVETTATTEDDSDKKSDVDRDHGDDVERDCEEKEPNLPLSPPFSSTSSTSYAARAKGESIGTEDSEKEVKKAAPGGHSTPKSPTSLSGVNASPVPDKVVLPTRPASEAKDVPSLEEAAIGKDKDSLDYHVATTKEADTVDVQTEKASHKPTGPSLPPKPNKTGEVKVVVPLPNATVPLAKIVITNHVPDLGPTPKRFYKYSKDDLFAIRQLLDINYFPSILKSFPFFVFESKKSIGASYNKRPPNVFEFNRYNFTSGGYNRPIGRENAFEFAPPSQPKPEIMVSKNAWISLQQRKSDMDTDKFASEELFGKVKAILNKMAPNNFAVLLEDFKNLSSKIDSQEKVGGVVAIIFKKALLEPIYADAYAVFLRALANFCSQNQTEFKPISLLLAMSQKEFYAINDDTKGEKEKEWEAKIAEATDENAKKILEEDYNEFLLKARDRYLGNIKFLSELYKQSLISSRILCDCIQLLFNTKTEIAYEGMCSLMRFAGKTYSDRVSSKGETNIITGLLANMKELIKDKSLPSRIKFMMVDILELEENRWVPRRDEDLPKTFDEINKEIARENEEIKKIAASSTKKFYKRDSIRPESPVISPMNYGGGSFDTGKNLASRPSSNLQRTQELDIDAIKLAPSCARWNKGSSVNTKPHTGISSYGPTTTPGQGSFKPDHRLPSSLAPPPSILAKNSFGALAAPLSPVSPDEPFTEYYNTSAAIKKPSQIKNMPSNTYNNGKVSVQADVPVVKTIYPQEEAEREFKSGLKSYFFTKLDEELIECAQKFRCQPALFASDPMLHYVFDQHASERDKYAGALLLLISKGICTYDDIIGQMAIFLENADDTLEDYPLLYQYLAHIIVPLILNAPSYGLASLPQDITARHISDLFKNLYECDRKIFTDQLLKYLDSFVKDPTATTVPLQRTIDSFRGAILSNSITPSTTIDVRLNADGDIQPTHLELGTSHEDDQLSERLYRLVTSSQMSDEEITFRLSTYLDSSSVTGTSVANDHEYDVKSLVVNATAVLGKALTALTDPVRARLVLDCLRDKLDSTLSTQTDRDTVIEELSKLIDTRSRTVTTTGD